MFSATDSARGVGAYGLILLVLAFAGYVVRQVFFHPLSDIPGPLPAKLTRWWQAYEVWSGHAEKTEIALHEKYGSLVRVAPNQVSISDPEAIKLIYGPNSRFPKTDMYAAWKHGYDNMFTYRNEKEHAKHRRAVGNAYAMSSVLDSEGYVDQCSDIFLQRLGEMAQAGQAVDLGHWLQMYAFDVVTELFYGKAFGLMEARQDFGWFELLEGVVQAVAIMGMIPYVVSFYHMPLWQKIFPGVKEANEKQFKMISVAQERVAERMKAKGGRRDMMEKFIERHRESPDDMTVQWIEMEAVVALFAGSDTTASALRSMFYYLLKNPATYQALRKEIDDMDAQRELSSKISFAESNKMPYLLAVCKEAMRLNPSVGLGLPRYVPQGGREICGRFFPEGTRVAINAWVVHLDEKVFGRDPKAFRPERWIEGDAKVMDRYMFQFGSGSRTCTGKNIAILQLQKVVPEILRRFDISLVEPSKPWHTINHFFVKQEGLNVHLQERVRK
ncbi:hypothetical protein LTR47_000500 [Exophiala xenobiotica]|nr:hypothetical protein LTR47_000500 [Exophiala xenobiotica]KAK5255679.1 hypothetical protein LTS06_000135 [Exophiala xenobiotica]KAK5350188.1 hypothetical protein LTR61_006163 [Exophiala xenobiotica]KAK5387564.1 hypothetical protein LTR11_001229 [Exophiala xenobiotica]KAK5388924.1 hypothetical protein LTS03_001345 [Exophiala xenobiotica]